MVPRAKVRESYALSDIDKSTDEEDEEDEKQFESDEESSLNGEIY